MTSATWQPCPEAVYGQHGEPSASGHCPYCGRRIAPKRRRPGMDFGTRKRRAREQDPLSIEPDEGSYYEE